VHVRTTIQTHMPYSNTHMRKSVAHDKNNNSQSPASDDVRMDERKVATIEHRRGQGRIEETRLKQEMFSFNLTASTLPLSSDPSFT